MIVQFKESFFNLSFISLLIIFYACGTTKRVYDYDKYDGVVKTAKNYLNTPYKYGGQSKRGMDCSGLIFLSYQKNGIILPRTSKDLAKIGKKIGLSNVKKGDLLFFNTSKSSRKVNHIGLVTHVDNGGIRFIHSTTSKGVIITYLSQKYWSKRFTFARRVLN